MSAAPNLDRLDAGGGGPFWFKHDGQLHAAVNPADLSYGAVIVALHRESVPGTPNMPVFKHDHLFRRWMAHYDLLPFAAAQRLAYVVEKYADDLEFDLRNHASIDLGEAWRSRRWRTLLGAIDRLPSHCYYAEAIGKDPEHARALAEAMAQTGEGKDSGPSAPPLRTWTPEVALLTDIYDAIRHLDWTTLAVQAGNKAPKPPEPRPRPSNLLGQATKKAEHRRRLEAHQRLTQRLLPHKRPAE